MSPLYFSVPTGLPSTTNLLTVNSLTDDSASPLLSSTLLPSSFIFLDRGSTDTGVVFVAADAAVDAAAAAVPSRGLPLLRENQLLLFPPVAS